MEVTKSLIGSRMTTTPVDELHDSIMVAIDILNNKEGVKDLVRLMRLRSLKMKPSVCFRYRC